MSACAYVFMCAHINFFQTINYTYDQQLIAEDQTSAMLNHCTSPTLRPLREILLFQHICQLSAALVRKFTPDVVTLGGFRIFHYMFATKKRNFYNYTNIFYISICHLGDYTRSYICTCINVVAYINLYSEIGLSLL